MRRLAAYLRVLVGAVGLAICLYSVGDLENDADQANYDLNVASSHLLVDGRASTADYHKVSSENPTVKPVPRQNAEPAVAVDQTIMSTLGTVVTESDEDIRWLYGGAAASILLILTGLAGVGRNSSKDAD